MPAAILAPLVAAFAVAMATTSLSLWRSARDGRPPEAVTLVELNFLGAGLGYFLLRDRRWRADWRALKAASPGLFEALNLPAHEIDPAALLARVPREPAHMSLTEPATEASISWPRTEQAWANREDSPEFIAVRILRRLARLRQTGAYVGRTYQAVPWTERARAGGEGVRLVHSRGVPAGQQPMYTFRKDCGRLHMVAVFNVREEGNKITVWWEAGVHRVDFRDVLHRMFLPTAFLITGAVGLRPPPYLLPLLLALFLFSFARPEPLGALRVVALYAGLAFLAVGLLDEFSDKNLHVTGRLPAATLLFLAWLHALLEYPPGRGWTSLWAKVTRDRWRPSQAGTTSADAEERRTAKEFLDFVYQEFRRIQAGQLG